MRDAFESWIGQEVVVQLGLGLIKVSLRGVLLRDLTETLLMRPEAGADVEIAKCKILAIEEVERSRDSLPWYVLPPTIIDNPVNQDIQPMSKIRT
ncbi:MAG TPA: hypothetical protein VJN92_02775 [Candidatus Acidoferrum sp.]|nr:hypothetical protein [Candidatus Acidoferrum sp.]